jgi:hypothetical protein
MDLPVARPAAPMIGGSMNSPVNFKIIPNEFWLRAALGGHPGP